MSCMGAVALSRDAHLIGDEAVAKMGHPEAGRPTIWKQNRTSPNLFVLDSS
jgi:hypothetical protein